MQAVQTAHVLAVGAGLAAEAGSVGGHPHGEVPAVENHVAVDVRNGHLGRRHEVEVVGRGVVHLPLLVGQLARAEARSLVDHHRRLHFEVAGLRVAVEEIVDQRTLQTGALAFVDGESGAGEFHAEVEVDDVVFACQLPVGQRVLGQRRVAFDELHDEVVRRGLPFGHDVRGKVGQRDDLRLQLLGGLFLFGGQLGRKRFQIRDEALALLGLVAAALSHEHADLFGGLILGGQIVVQLGLEGFAAVVQLFDAGDRGGGVHALLGQLADRSLPVVPELLQS